MLLWMPVKYKSEYRANGKAKHLLEIEFLLRESVLSIYEYQQRLCNSNEISSFLVSFPVFVCLFVF